MENKKLSLVIGLIAIVVLFIEAQLLMKPSKIPVQDQSPIGAQSGQTQFAKQYFPASYQVGGTTLSTTSTATAFTLTAKEINSERYMLYWNPGQNITLTTMATTSMPWLGRNLGDTQKFMVYNASSTGTITFAAGTGVDFQKNEDTADLAIPALGFAELTFIRKQKVGTNSGDVIMLMTEYAVAD